MRAFVLCLLLLTAACAEDAPPQPKQGALDFLDPGGAVIRSITVEIAEDEESRQRGLMDRRQLTLSEGMLFLFPVPDSLSFWMKNTMLPLDIMFVAADSSIINIARRTTPLSTTRVTSDGLAQYVVEVRGGFSDRFGINEQVRVRWRRTP